MTSDTPSTEARYDKVAREVIASYTPDMQAAIRRVVRQEAADTAPHDPYRELLQGERSVHAVRDALTRQGAADPSGLPDLLDNANPNKVALWQRNKGWLTDEEAEAVIRAALRGATERPLDLGDKIGRAMHEAAQVGGPWAPCPFPYNQWPDCEHQPMGQHVATIVLGIDNA